MPSLTDKLIQSTKPSEKPVRLVDGEGLLMIIQPTGARWWRFRYRFNGSAKMLSFGTYPNTTLRRAREKHVEARRLLAQGIDPSAHRQATRETVTDGGADSFENVAREWFLKSSPGWAASHSDKIIQRLERDIFPWLGGRPIASVTAQEILACVRRVEARGAIDTSHRCMQNIGQIFRYGIAIGKVERNPIPDLQGSLPSAKAGHFAAIIDPVKFGQLLRAIDGYGGFISVRAAMKLLPLVFVRPGELRLMEWGEIDLDGATWSIPAERMKLKLPHIVPLATQAIEILREIHAFSGRGTFVFPTPRNKNMPVSNMAFGTALKALGYSGQEHTPHGFRASARTMLDEVLGFKIDLIEHQLAHAVKDPLGRSYNRTTHLPERKRMMQEWANYLDLLRK